jgi:hypothetical protein
VQKRIVSDPAFGEALLREGIDTMLAGDDAGKAILRDYIKATVGFEKLGEATGTQQKSLIRMFGPRDNPQARNIFGIIGYLQKQAGVELHVTQRPGKAQEQPRSTNWCVTSRPISPSATPIQSPTSGRPKAPKSSPKSSASAPPSTKPRPHELYVGN